MKIPEFVFPLINFAMGLLLKSPLHWIMSKSVLLVTFTGRISGKTFTTPVRFVRDGNVIRAFSSPAANWWKNLRGGADVSITINGKPLPRRGIVLEVDDDTKMRMVVSYLTAFPTDGAYHGIKARRNRPLPLDAIRATLDDIAVIEFR